MPWQRDSWQDVLISSGRHAQTEAAADTFNPDKEAGVSIEELREKLGDVPKQDGEVKLGAVAKSFDNEYWRTLREGYGEYQTKQPQPAAISP